MPGENVKTLKIRYKQIINVPNKKTLSGGKKKKNEIANENDKNVVNDTNVASANITSLDDKDKVSLEVWDQLCKKDFTFLNWKCKHIKIKGAVTKKKLVKKLHREWEIKNGIDLENGEKIEYCK